MTARPLFSDSLRCRNRQSVAVFVGAMTLGIASALFFLVVNA